MILIITMFLVIFVTNVVINVNTISEEKISHVAMYHGNKWNNVCGNSGNSGFLNACIGEDLQLRKRVEVEYTCVSGILYFSRVYGVLFDRNFAVFVFRGDLCDAVIVIDLRRGIVTYFEESSVALSSISVSGGYLIVSDDPLSWTLLCVDMGSGRVVWRKFGFGDLGMVGDPVVCDGVVYYAFCSGDVYAFSVCNGSVIGHVDIGSPVYVTPAVVNGTIYVGDILGNVYRIENWTVNRIFKARGGILGRVMVVGGRIFVYDGLGYVYCIDDSGELHWVRRLDGFITGIYWSNVGIIVNIERINCICSCILSVLDGSIVREYNATRIQVVGDYMMTRSKLINLITGSIIESSSIAKDFEFGAINMDMLLLFNITRRTMIIETPEIPIGIPIVTLKVIVYDIIHEAYIDDTPRRVELSPGAFSTIKFDIMYKGTVTLDYINVSVKAHPPVKIEKLKVYRDGIYLTILADSLALDLETLMTVNVTFKLVNGEKISYLIPVKVKIYEPTPLIGYILGFEIVLAYMIATKVKWT